MKYKYISIIMLFSLLIISCSDDSVSNKLFQPNDFEGYWNYDNFEPPKIIDLKPTENSITLEGLRYEGAYTDYGFKGWYIDIRDSVIVYKASLTLGFNNNKEVFGTETAYFYNNGVPKEPSTTHHSFKKL